MKVITQQIGTTTQYDFYGNIIKQEPITRTYIKPSKLYRVIHNRLFWMSIFGCAVNITSFIITNN